MQEFDIPIFKASYDLYKDFYGIRRKVSKQDRYSIYLKCENLIIEIIEGIINAGRLSKIQKLPVLEKTSLKLNLLRVFIRLMKDVKTIDLKTYAKFESQIDEIGRMLGGWIRSTKQA